MKGSPVRVRASALRKPRSCTRLSLGSAPSDTTTLRLVSVGLARQHIGRRDCESVRGQHGGPTWPIVRLGVNIDHDLTIGGAGGREANPSLSDLVLSGGGWALRPLAFLLNR